METPESASEKSPQCLSSETEKQNESEDVSQLSKVGQESRKIASEDTVDSTKSKSDNEDKVIEADRESTEIPSDGPKKSSDSENKESVKENKPESDKESDIGVTAVSESSSRNKRKRSVSGNKSSVTEESAELLLDDSANSSKSKRKKGINEDKAPTKEVTSELSCSLPHLSSTPKTDQPGTAVKSEESEVTIKVEAPEPVTENLTPVRYSSSGRKISRKSFSDELYITPDSAMKSSSAKEEKTPTQYSSSGRKISKKSFGDDVHTPPIAVVSPVIPKYVKSEKKGSGGDFIKPFSMGWMREVVFRATNDTPPTGKRKADIYYFTPEGTKLRSMPEIGAYLAKNKITSLELSNFTFVKEAIYREPFEKERSAKLKLGGPAPKSKKEVNADSKSGSVTEEKRVPKIKLPFTFDTPAKSSPKAAATVKEEKPKEQLKRPANKQTGSIQHSGSKKKKNDPVGVGEKRKITRQTRKRE